MHRVNRYCFGFLVCMLTLAAQAAETFIIDHYDSIEINSSLSLKELVTMTLQKYPDVAMISARKQEAKALRRQGNNWFAGSPSFSIRYQDDRPGDDTGLREMESELELPIWNFGQRTAGQILAEKAVTSSGFQSRLIEWQVAGLVRKALWRLALTENRHQFGKQISDTSEKLVRTVKRRAELGDLPRSDVLLAQSNAMEKRSQLLKAEAETMHARKHYSVLTQTSQIPATYIEIQSQINEITQLHPTLSALNGVISRKEAELRWIKSEGSGQPSLKLGGKSERGSRQDRDIESISISFSVPFGGRALLEPKVASLQLELTEMIVQREHLYRELEENLHEAKHALQIDRAELLLAEEGKKLAEENLTMARFSFETGESNLLDLLRMQNRVHSVIRSAQEHVIKLQRDTSLYNQAVGQVP